MPSTDDPSDLAAWGRLERLREGFARSAGAPGLFHATRVMVDSSRESPQDLKQDWEGFLEVVEPFAHSMFCDPSIPWIQHSCYFGERDKLHDFQGLAASAALIVPHHFCRRVSANPKDWETDENAQQWMFVLYRFANSFPAMLPVRRNIVRDIDDPEKQISLGRFDPLTMIALMDREGHPFNEWKRSFPNEEGELPKYVYASLSLDVFQCSVAVIDHILDHREKHYRSDLPWDIADVEPIVPGEVVEEELSDTRGDDDAIGPGVIEDGDVPRVEDEWDAIETSLDPPYVDLNGTRHEVSLDAATFFRALHEARGATRTSKNMAKKYPILDGFRWDRKGKKLPVELQKIVKSRPGSGFWIVLT